MAGKPNRVQVRIEPDLRARIDTAVATTGIPEPVVVTKCLEAYCTYVEQQGQITFPLLLRPKGVEVANAQPGTSLPHTEKAVKRGVITERPHLRDVQEVSLPIFGTVPAGWPSDNQFIKPKRNVKVPKGKYSSRAFGLEVSGDSMNAALGRIGPISHGDIVVVEPFETAQKAEGKIVAALSDGLTTLKRLTVLPGGQLELTSETKDPSADRRIAPEYDLVIQGVVVARLEA